jgi:hypothetical protein
MKHTTMPGFTAEHSLYIDDIGYGSPRGSTKSRRSAGLYLPKP